MGLVNQIKKILDESSDDNQIDSSSKKPVTTQDKLKQIGAQKQVPVASINLEDSPGETFKAILDDLKKNLWDYGNKQSH